MNLILYRTGSNQINEFVQDCVKCRNDFEGSNIKLSGVNLSIFEYMWTQDIVTKTGSQWDKTVSQITPANSGIEIDNPDDTDYRNALEKLIWLSSKSYTQLNSHIDTNVTDLASAKVYLKDLSRCMLALLKVLNRHMK